MIIPTIKDVTDRMQNQNLRPQRLLRDGLLYSPKIFQLTKKFLNSPKNVSTRENVYELRCKITKLICGKKTELICENIVC